MGLDFFIYPDHLTTPRAITRPSGQVVWRWEGDPFGAARPDQDPDGNGKTFTYNLRFPGQYFDQETGLAYNYLRYYDPQTGRYIQADPIGLVGGMNPYSYVEGNPLSGYDPLGAQGQSSASATVTIGFNPGPGQEQLAQRLGCKQNPCVVQAPWSPEQAYMEARDLNALTGDAILLPRAVPPGADLAANMRLAREHVNDPLWFAMQVREGGPWDYKRLGRQYEEFGNLNFGATGKAAGFRRYLLGRVCRRCAVSQRHL